jgi:chromosome segregation ATPase
VHTTGSYLYDLDHMMVNLSLESERLHQGYYESVRHIDVLEHEIRGWSWIYTAAQAEARNNQVNYVETNMRRKAEVQLRMTAEAKLLESETELQKLQAEKTEWERKEKDYVTSISKLKDRATDSKGECRQLQTQVEDQ